MRVKNLSEYYAWNVEKLGLADEALKEFKESMKICPKLMVVTTLALSRLLLASLRKV